MAQWLEPLGPMCLGPRPNKVWAQARQNTFAQMKTHRISTTTTWPGQQILKIDSRAKSIGSRAAVKDSEKNRSTGCRFPKESIPESIPTFDSDSDFTRISVNDFTTQGSMLTQYFYNDFTRITAIDFTRISDVVVVTDSMGHLTQPVNSARVWFTR